MNTKHQTNVFLSVLVVLTKYGLLDDSGHIPNCGYTEQHQTCKCSSLGHELQEAINQNQKINTYEELNKAVEEILPGASIERDNYSQLVIYTGLVEVDNKLFDFSG